MGFYLQKLYNYWAWLCQEFLASPGNGLKSNQGCHELDNLKKYVLQASTVLKNKKSSALGCYPKQPDSSPKHARI